MKKTNIKYIGTKTRPWNIVPWKGELKMMGGLGTKVIICPERKHAGDLKDIDLIRLELSNAKGEKGEFWMTPDEALDISGVLSTAVSFWLTLKYQPYMEKFNIRRNSLTKEFNKSKKIRNENSLGKNVENNKQ